MTSSRETAKYSDLELIGSGTFGSVFKVRRKSDGKIFARKEVRFPEAGERARKAVLDEIRVLSSIRHPNIVAYKESFSDPARETVHIVMEYCTRGDLGGHIMKTAKAGGKITLAHIWSIIDQIGLALFRCHHGRNHPQDPAGYYVSMPGQHIRVYHRDLKPANVFINPHGVIKLGDFGLCAIMEPHERMRSSFVGTPDYMAPEMTGEEPYSEKSESWALGCIAHELATLQPTFQTAGENTVQMTKRVKHRAYPSIPPEYGTDLPDIIASCFRLDPEQRPGMKAILDHPYIVESRCHRQLGSSHVRFEKEREREGALKRREDALQKREADLLAKVTASESVAAELQKRERAIWALDLKFTGRELHVRQRENAMLEDHTKWEKERAIMGDKRAKIQAEEAKSLALQTKVKKEHEARRTELRKMEKALKKKQDAIHREEARQREAWASKTVELAEAEANMAANLKGEMEERFRRQVESAVRHATKQARRAIIRGRATRSSLAPFPTQKNGTKRQSDSIRKKLWESAGPGSTAMELGDTFYINNGLKIYSGAGKGADAESSKDGGAPDPDAMDVGQSFYIRNA